MQQTNELSKGTALSWRVTSQVTIQYDNKRLPLIINKSMTVHPIIQESNKL